MSREQITNDKKERLEKKYRNDILLGIFFILLTGILLWIYSVGNTDTDAVVKIERDGEVLQTLPLNEDDRLEIKSEYGINIIEICSGKVKMKEADCSDHYCEKRGTISKMGESIICLPHKLVITIESRDEEGLDAIAQ